jgi:hypothetical protein
VTYASPDGRRAARVELFLGAGQMFNLIRKVSFLPVANLARDWMRKTSFLSLLILLSSIYAPSESHAGPLLDWLTGWYQGYGTQPTVVGYPPQYAAYPNYPSQVGTYTPAYPTQVAGYAPTAGFGAQSGVVPTVAYSPFQSPGSPAPGGGLFSGWGHRHHHHRPAAAACQPCAPQVALAPVAACNPCTQQTFRQQVVGYMPQTYYRTVQRRVPVTNYRPVMTVDPCTGCPVTAMQPCVTYTVQTARVPVHICRPIMSTVPAGPCSPCQQPACPAPMAATPYYPGPAATPGVMTTPGIVTSPGVTTVPATPSPYIVPGQGGLQPADIRPALPQMHGPTPDTGVGSRVNRPLGDPYYSPTVPGVQTQPQIRTESQYQPQFPLQRSGAPEIGSAGSPSVRLQRQEAPAVDANPDTPLRPIPKLEVEKTGIPAQPAFEAPDLLDPRDRTASVPTRRRAYSLIAWPEPLSKADAPQAPLVRPAARVTPLEGEVELVGPVRSLSSDGSAKPMADDRWDDTGWRSAY